MTLNLISVREASEKFGYSESHIRGLLGRGLIAGRKFAGVWMADPTSIERYRTRMGQLGPRKHGTWAMNVARGGTLPEDGTSNSSRGHTEHDC